MALNNTNERKEKKLNESIFFQTQRIVLSALITSEIY